MLWHYFYWYSFQNITKQLVLWVKYMIKEKD